MNKTYRKFSQSLISLLTSDRSMELPAFLGNRTGVVKADDLGNVYVTLMNGEVTTVFNGRVPLAARLPVIIGYASRNSTRVEVLRARDVYPTPPFAEVANHGKNHSFGGVDVIPIYGEQFLPGLVTPLSGLTVKLFGFVYSIDNTWMTLATQEIDLSANLPANGALYALLEADNTGTVSVNLGATVNQINALEYSNIPTPSTNNVPLFAVRLYTSQTAIREKDLVDLRWSKYTKPVSGSAFQRNLSADLALADGESLVVTGYINQGSYNITLAGDAVLHIL